MSGIPEDLQSLKVIELKELSAAFNLPKSGNKKDLIQRLQDLKAVLDAQYAQRKANETIVVPEPAVPQMPLPLPQEVQVAPENPLHSVQLQFTPEQVADSISLTATPLEEPEPLPVPVAPEIAPEPVNDTTQVAPEATATVLENGVEEPMVANDDSKCADEIVISATLEDDTETLDWEVEDESFLHDSSKPVDVSLDKGEEEQEQTASADMKELVTVDADVDNREEGELPTPTEMDEGEIRDGDDVVSPAEVKKSNSDSVANEDDDASKRRKEDKSREVEGTQQTTLVVAAKGDRPSFDIKIVTPVKTQSKPVKIRKRHEAGEVTAEQQTEGASEQSAAVAKTKKRKWLTSQTPSDTPQNIVISTDVLKDIVSPTKSSPEKEKSSFSRSEKSSADLEKHAKDDEKKETKSAKQKPEVPTTEKVESVAGAGAETSGGEVGEKTAVEGGETEDKKKLDRKTSKSGREEDLEEGEHKSKYAQISFSDVDPGKALKPVKVKSRGDPDSSSAPQQVDLPKREEPEVAVPEARNPVSTIVHVMRLTRPFTVPQLKALLAHFGEMVNEEFWIDDIKSQCYVKYKLESSAKECRETLYGCKWPAANHRTLKLEFVSQIQLDDVRGILPPKQTIVRRKSSSSPLGHHKAKIPADDDYMGRSAKYSTGHLGKVSAKDRRRSRSVSRESEEFLTRKIAKVESRKREREGRGAGDMARGEMRGEPLGKSNAARKELEMRDKYHERREQKRKEEEERLKNQEEQAPVKLLDDLFRKTKAEPWVYWLPLTDEQTAGRDKRRALELRQLQEESIKLKNTIANTSSHGNRDHRDLSPQPEDRGARYASASKRGQRSNYDSPPPAPHSGSNRHRRSPQSPLSPPTNNRSDRNYHSGDRRGPPSGSHNSSKVRGHMKQSDRHSGRYR